MLEQRLQLRAEHHRAPRKLGVEERLDAEPVARQEEHPPAAIPERKREHPPESLDAVFAPCLPGMDDDFGVGARVEAVAERNELGDEFLEVVDFAVEDHRHAVVLVPQRLLAGGDVDDRQPAMTEADVRLDVGAASIRSAMVLRFVHAMQQRGIDCRVADGSEDSGDPAHDRYPGRARQSISAGGAISAIAAPGARLRNSRS